MSQIKAKQINFTAAGQLIIGTATGGTYLTKGTEGQVLRATASGVEWATPETVDTTQIISPDLFNKVVATDADGIDVFVANDTGDATVNVLSFVKGAESDEKLSFETSTGNVTLTASGTEDDVNIVIVPKGAGEVVFGSSGDGYITADSGHDLTITGGDATGNLFLNGSTAGKVFYALDDTDPDTEVATVGDIADAIANIPTPEPYQVLRYAGDATFTLPATHVIATLVVTINGLGVDVAAYSVTTNVLTFNTGTLGYTLEASDKVVFMFENAVA